MRAPRVVRTVATTAAVVLVLVACGAGGDSDDGAVSAPDADPTGSTASASPTAETTATGSTEPSDPAEETTAEPADGARLEVLNGVSLRAPREAGRATGDSTFRSAIGGGINVTLTLLPAQPGTEADLSAIPGAGEEYRRGADVDVAGVRMQSGTATLDQRPPVHSTVLYVNRDEWDVVVFVETDSADEAERRRLLDSVLATVVWN